VSNQAHHRHYNVTATYPDMEHAREGVRVLEDRNVEATTIFLAGRAAHEAATQTETAQRDRAWLNYSWRTGRGGILRGIVIGAIAGLVIALIAVGTSPIAIGGTVIGCAAAGACLGFFEALLSGQKISGAFEETFADVEGPVVVGVHTDDRSMFETAAAALAETDPQSMERFDDSGNALPKAP
jgi:hypothetical protein